MYILLVDQASCQDIVEDKRRYNVIQSDFEPQKTGSLSLFTFQYII